VASCKGCGAAIVWAVTPEGKRQPFDRVPDSKGNRVLLGRGPDRPPLALPINVLVGGPEEPRNLNDGLRGQVAYMPHHATCPFVEDFRP